MKGYVTIEGIFIAIPLGLGIVSFWKNGIKDWAGWVCLGLATLAGLLIYRFYKKKENNK